MRLRANEFCPIHKSISCCGREFIPKRRTIRPGVQRIEDPHHPRGYRELRSPAEMKKLLNRKIVEQNGICGLREESLTDYNDVVPDHMCVKAYPCRVYAIMLPRESAASYSFLANERAPQLRRQNHKLAAIAGLRMCGPQVLSTEQCKLPKGVDAIVDDMRA